MDDGGREPRHGSRGAGVCGHGSNVLALHRGSIQRILTNTVAGTTYTLTFSAHGRPYLVPPLLSWWKAEGIALDSGSGQNPGTPQGATTFATGLVGQAFDFSGFSDVLVPDAPNLEFTNLMTAEAWIYPTNISIGTTYSILTKFDVVDTGGAAYSLGIDGTAGQGSMQISSDGINSVGVLTTTAIPSNQWTHIASTYDGNNINIYLNGTLQGTMAAPGGIFPGNDDFGIGATVGGEFGGARFPFSGLIDEAAVYSNTLSIAQIEDIYAAGSAGKVGSADSPQVGATVNIGNITTNIAAGDAWTPVSITFIATSNNMALEIIPGGDGVLLDTFVVQQNAQASTNNYFLPEESLSKVVGQNPSGAWQLEVLDNRAGPPSPNPAPLLVSWELSLVTENLTPTAIPLLPQIGQSNTVPPNLTVYYIVNVPPWALFATNSLFNVSGGSVALTFNQNFEPGTGNSGDVTLLTNISSSGSVTLSTSNGNPLLLPGEQYYLGVQNLGVTPVNFGIEVDFNIESLTNMVPVTNTISPSTISPQYYQFNVDTNAIAAEFQLLNVSGN